MTPRAEPARSATRIEAEYARRHPESARFAERARRVCPGGVSQAFRDTQPFPICYERAAGTRKWTIDGTEIVDYSMGHGSLILGHGDPDVEEAVRAQLARGTHFTGISSPEIELAELVCELVPGAEAVRFAATGSEACMLAIRLARSATGKDRFIKFAGHYHGWHDHTFIALRPPYDRPHTGGVPQAVRDQCIVLPPNDAAAVERALSDRDDIACVIVEPAGGGHGTIPTSVEWIRALRELTRAHGIPLVFDEMVSGFRLAPGGYQEWSGVQADLTALGKTMFGGLPGGAVAGTAELMNLTRVGAERFVAHWGTWNAFPVACAAGAAALRKLRDGTVQAGIARHGERVRAELNRAIAFDRRRGTRLRHGVAHPLPAARVAVRRQLRGAARRASRRAGARSGSVPPVPHGHAGARRRCGSREQHQRASRRRRGGADPRRLHRDARDDARRRTTRRRVIARCISF